MKSSGEVKLFAGILVVAIVLVGVTLWASSGQQGPVPPPPPQPTTVNVSKSALVAPGFHMRGEASAPNTLVEFGDFLCPMCRSSVTTVDEALAQHKGKLNFVFHCYRAAAAHVAGPMMARAAEAAANQGKFWEMSKALFDHQDEFEGVPEKEAGPKIMGLAQDVGLDMNRFRVDFDSEDVKRRVDADQKLGASKEVDVHATPTFFIYRQGAAATRLNSLQQLQDWFADPRNMK